jgi:phage gpG-like protein
MTVTILVDGYENLHEVYDSIAEDFNSIDYSEWMKSELDEMAHAHSGYFQRSVSPDGIPWKPNAPRTIAAKGHSRILRGKPSNQYRLSRSLAARGQPGGDSIREAIQTNTGAYMSFGTAVEYALQNDQGTARIPARPHVGINEAYLDAMTERVADYVIRKLAKG